MNCEYCPIPKPALMIAVVKKALERPDLCPECQAQLRALVSEPEND